MYVISPQYKRKESSFNEGKNLLQFGDIGTCHTNFHEADGDKSTQMLTWKSASVTF